jgi:hypothetical protein
VLLLGQQPGNVLQCFSWFSKCINCIKCENN